MTHPAAADDRIWSRPRAAALLFAGLALVGLLAWHGGSSSVAGRVLGSGSSHSVTGATGGPIGRADGVLAAGVTVFDRRDPGVTRLDPDLLDALRAAATDAARDGVEIDVTSGWRSPAYQDKLLREAIATYGSERAAARWVATPTTSPHVHGEAADLGPARATAWLERHGAAYGLCRIYRNEPWHFELRPAAVRHGCPAPYADPTDDPRLRQQAGSSGALRAARLDDLAGTLEGLLGSAGA